MSHVKRILFWTILLIGSAVLFYLWSTQQMKMIGEKNLEYFESAPVVKPIIVDSGSVLSDFYQISTSSSMQILLQKDLDKNEWSTSTLKISTTTIDDSKFGFIYPDQNSNLYQNCKYKIILDTGEISKPNYVGVSLVDAGNGKEVISKQSGLIHSLTLNQNSFLWSVGNIWPGEYYLLVSMIDGQEVSITSQKFYIIKNDVEMCGN